jgi:Spy/CpxP family protein refolding chaperone
MTRFRTLMAGLAVAGLLTGGAAFAQGPRAGGPGGHGRGMMGRDGGLALGGITLTQAQQDLIRDIRERHRQETQPAAAKVRELQEAQRKAVQAIPLDEGRIRAATLALADAQADLAVQQARLQNEIFATLTPEQQAQVTTARAEREARRGKR